MDDRQLEMQTQRLLEDDGLELAPFRQQPLDLHVPRPSRKVKRSSLTPARFCIGFCSLVGLLIASAICYGLYSAFRFAGRPHASHHANQTLLSDPGRGNELVRPFFGPPASGAPLATFDLGLLVHARWDVEMESERNTTTEPGRKLTFVSYRPKNASAHVDVWRKVLSDGEGLSMRPFATGPWRELHRSIVLKDVPLETRPVQTTVPISFPREIIRSLINQTAKAEVVASFFMLPPAGWESSLLRSDDAHPAKVVSTRVQLHDGQSLNAAARLPPVWSSPSSADGPLTDLLSRAVAYEDLKHDRGLLNETDPWSQTYDVRLRAWVTTPRDFAVYNLTSFREAMRQQKEHLRGACNEGRDRKSPSCWPAFAQFGHFEHLLQVNGSTEADARQWYAPSLIADLGEASAKDYVPLPVFRGNVSEADVEDFLFDYRITFSPSSVRKLAILQHVLRKAIQEANIEAPRHNQTDYERASDYDSAEFWNALRGHPFEPGTRPVARGLLAFVAGLLDMLAPAVQLYFFQTRTLTTGLSMPALALDQANDFCWAFIDGFRWYMYGHGPLVISLGVVGFSLVLICAVANLALRLEWLWGGPLGWVPVSISRRRPTHSERASARADARFIWRDRAIFLAVCFLLYAYGPSTPQIIAASPPSAKGSLPGFILQVTPSSSFLSRTFIPLLGPLFKTVWWFAAVSQLHLNWRLKSFGESKLYLAMCFAKAVLNWIPIVFHARLGRAELMEALTLQGAVGMCAHGALVYQAWLYPSVPQEEAEDE